MNPFALFQGASFVSKIVVIVGLAGAVIAAYAAWHYTIYNRGWKAAIAAIAVQDERAITEANNERRIVEACRARGGTWNNASWVCE